MSKVCISLEDDDFQKCLKKSFLDKKRIKKIMDTIGELEKAENEHFSMGGKDRTNLNRFGKTLSAMNQKDIYCLEVGTDRFLAHVVEDEKSKVFVWFWGGSHEAYNKMLKNLSNNKSLNVSAEKIEEEKQKAGITENIKSVTGKFRDDLSNNKFNKKHS